VGPLSDIIGRSSNEVDLYLTGPTHAAYNCVIAGKRATSVVVGRVLTDANLRVDRRTGQVVSVTADNSIVTQDVAKDPAQPGDHDPHGRPDRSGPRAAMGRPGHEPEGASGLQGPDVHLERLGAARLARR
jgi:hypothetical protein